MNKLLLSFGLTLLISLTAIAQDSKFYGGIKGGLTLPIFSEITEGSKPKIGYDGGFFACYRISNETGIGGEIYYDISTIENKNIDTELSVSNINTPIYIKRGIGSNFSAFVGGELSFLASSEVRSPSTGGLNADEYFNDINASFIAGFMYDINDIIGLDIRYNTGLTAISDYDTVKLSRFAFNINFKF